MCRNKGCLVQHRRVYPAAAAGPRAGLRSKGVARSSRHTSGNDPNEIVAGPHCPGRAAPHPHAAGGPHALASAGPLPRRRRAPPPSPRPIRPRPIPQDRLNLTPLGTIRADHVVGGGGGGSGDRPTDYQRGLLDLPQGRPAPSGWGANSGSSAWQPLPRRSVPLQAARPSTVPSIIFRPFAGCH